MNAVLTAPSRPPTVAVRRVGLADRLALRVGLALIVWGRRPQRVERFVTREELVELARLEGARHTRTSLGHFV